MGNIGAPDVSALLDHGIGKDHISISPVNDQAVDVNGSAVTLANLKGGNTYFVVAMVGASGFVPTSSNYCELELEEYNGSSWSDVANANLTRVSLTTAGGAATNAGTFAVIDETDRDARLWSTTYLRTSLDITQVRVVANFTGTVTNGIPLACAVTQANPLDAPTAGS